MLEEQLRWRTERKQLRRTLNKSLLVASNLSHDCGRFLASLHFDLLFNIVWPLFGRTDRMMAHCVSRFMMDREQVLIYFDTQN